MLPRGLATSAFFCALSAVLAPGVRGADLYIPIVQVRTTKQSDPTNALQKITGNGYTVPTYSATVTKASDGIKLYSPSTQLPMALRNQTSVLSSSEEWITGFHKIEPCVTPFCENNTSGAETSNLSSISTAGISNDSQERTTMMAEKVSYEPNSQLLRSVPTGAQVDERLTAFLTIPVSSHYLAKITTNIPQPSYSPAPAKDILLLESQTSAFSGTERERSLLESIASEISTAPYLQSFGSIPAAHSLEVHKTVLPPRTNEESIVAHRLTTYFGTATLAADSSTAHDVLASESYANTALLPGTQSTKLNSIQGEVSSAVGIQTSLPEVQVTKTHSTKHEQPDREKLTEPSPVSHISSEINWPTTSPNHIVSTSTSPIIESQIEYLKYPLLSDVGATAATLPRTVTIELHSTQHEQSSSANLLASLLAQQQIQQADSGSVMPLWYGTSIVQTSTEHYVQPSSTSEISSTPATQGTETSADHSSKLDRTALFLKTKATILPSMQEYLSFVHLSITQAHLAGFDPTQETSTSTSAFITAMAMPSSNKVVTTLVVVAGSVVLVLLIICGSLLVLAYRAGKIGSFVLPQLHSKDTYRKKTNNLAHICLNSMSTPPTISFENEAFV